MPISKPLLELPLLDETDSQSIADPIGILISDPTAPRSVLLRTNPLSGGVPVPINLSGDGYSSQPTDTPYEFFPEELIAPYNFSVNLPIPDLSGSTTLGVGMIQMRNNLGRLDQAARYDWLGIEQNVYIGPPEPAPLTQFTRVSKGVSAGLSWNLDIIEVLNRDITFKLQTKLLKRRYRGSGAALRLNGTTQYANATLACPAGSVTFTGSLRMTASALSQRNIVGYRNGAGAGNRLIDVGRVGTDRISFAVRNDAGVQFTCDSPTAFLVGNGFNDFVTVLDAANSQIRLYIRLPTATSFSLVNTCPITGTYNTVLSNYTIGRLPDVASNFLQGDVDEFRMYSSALTLAEISAVFEREALGIEPNLYSYYKFNEGSGTTSANTVAGKPVLTLNATPAWVGSLEGDASLASTPKPVAMGVCRQVQPKWVDTQRLVAQFHDGSMQGITAIRDSGDPLTFGVDLSDIYSATPGAGTFNTCLAKGLVRFGSTPVGTITGDILGDNGGSLGYADTASEIDKKLKVDYGGLSLATEIDSYAYGLLQALNPATLGEYFDEPIFISEACTRVLKSIRAWGGPTRVGVHTVGRIDDPLNLTPTVSWNNSNINSASTGYHREPFGIRYGEIVVGYRPYHTTLTADQVAGSIGLATRDDYSKDYRYVSKPIEGASEDSNTLTVLTSMDNEADARIEMERLAAFLTRDLEIVRLNLTGGLFTHFIGTVVSLTIEQITHKGDTIYRYDTNGKKYIVIGISERISAGMPDGFDAVLLG